MTPPSTPIPGPLALSRFVSRPNRFLVYARLEGTNEVVAAHLPDPGRLRELLVEGRRVWLRPAEGAHRKTRWSAVLVETPDGEGVVSVDTSLPNRLIRAALEEKALTELAEWDLVRAEAPMGRSRFDFLLSHPDGRQLMVEVKSVTLVENGTGLFPDAVTERGARHVRHLRDLAGEDGWEAAILFVLQRDDASRIVAAHRIDPLFAEALAEARAVGVRVLGRRCSVSLERVTLGPPVPVE